MQHTSNVIEFTKWLRIFSVLCVPFLSCWAWRYQWWTKVVVFIWPKATICVTSMESLIIQQCSTLWTMKTMAGV